MPPKERTELIFPRKKYGRTHPELLFILINNIVYQIRATSKVEDQNPDSLTMLTIN